MYADVGTPVPELVLTLTSLLGNMAARWAGRTSEPDDSNKKASKTAQYITKPSILFAIHCF